MLEYYLDLASERDALAAAEERGGLNEEDQKRKSELDSLLRDEEIADDDDEWLSGEGDVDEVLLDGIPELEVDDA